jgi:hypothetical protein
MRRALVAAALLALPGCGKTNGPPYNNNDLQLLTAYTAKELCSCVFVMGRDDDFCAAWARQSPNLKTYQIDHDGKRVQTEAVLGWGARAHFVSPRRGCVADP